MSADLILDWGPSVAPIPDRTGRCIRHHTCEGAHLYPEDDWALVPPHRDSYSRFSYVFLLSFGNLPLRGPSLLLGHLPDLIFTHDQVLDHFDLILGTSWIPRYSLSSASFSSWTLINSLRSRSFIWSFYHPSISSNSITPFLYIILTYHPFISLIL